MHIPDGMLSNATVAVTGATSAGFVGYATAWVRKHLGQERIVLMAVMAALIFALQMLNFPVAGGTSGHFAGGALAAIVLGPWPAVIVMTTVMLIQALVFADGGILALGANVLNMAVLAPFVGYAIWALAARVRDTYSSRVAGAAVAGWCACVAAALAAAFEIWISGHAQLMVVMAAMGFWHALIGIGEGLVTAGLVGYVLKVRPDLIAGMPGSRSGGSVRPVAVGLGIIALLAVGLSFLASSSPDGLEFVYFEQGIGARFEEVRLFQSPLTGYALPGMDNERIAGVLAGLVGIVIVGAFIYVAATAGRSRRDDSADPRR